MEGSVTVRIYTVKSTMRQQAFARMEMSKFVWYVENVWLYLWPRNADLILMYCIVCRVVINGDIMAQSIVFHILIFYQADEYNIPVYCCSGSCWQFARFYVRTYHCDDVSKGSCREMQWGSYCHFTWLTRPLSCLYYDLTVQLLPSPMPTLSHWPLIFCEHG